MLSILIYILALVSLAGELALAAYAAQGNCLPLHYALRRFGRLLALLAVLAFTAALAMQLFAPVWLGWASAALAVLLFAVWGCFVSSAARCRFK